MSLVLRSTSAVRALVIAAVLAASPDRAAAASCSTATFDVYTASGFTCQHGGLTFGGFTLVDLAPGLAGNTVPTAASLTITPTTSAGGWFGFIFSPPLSVTGGELATGTSVSTYFGVNAAVALPVGTEVRNVWSAPTVTASEGLASIVMISSLAYTGSCYNSTLAGFSQNGVQTNNNGGLPWTTAGSTSTTTASLCSVFEAAVGAHRAFLPGQSGTASVAEYGFELRTPQQAVPEPASIALVASGLVAFSVARRRRTGAHAS